MKLQTVFFSIVLIGVGAVSTPLIHAQSFRNSLPPSTPVADPMLLPAVNTPVNQNVNSRQQKNRFVPASQQQRIAALPNAVSRSAPTRKSRLPGARDSIYEPTAVLAKVGPEYILAGDVMPQVDIVMWMMFKDRSPAEMEKYRRQLDTEKQMLIRSLLGQAIDSKILYVAFKRSMKPEELAQFEERASEVIDSAFESSIDETLAKVKMADKAEMKRLRARDMQITQLCTLMVENQVETHRELDGILRTFGTSLEQAKQAFAETNFGRQALTVDVKLSFEVTHQELLDYYFENVDDYKITEAISFEQLTVQFKNHETKQKAYQKICALGNSVLQGARFDQVAIAQSEGPKAKSGGKYELIERGDLVSEKVEEVAFDLPVNRMSPVIEDGNGFYIVRVQKHREENREKFIEVQSEIEQAIQNERRNEAIQKYITKVKAHIPVWNSFEAQRQ